MKIPLSSLLLIVALASQAQTSFNKPTLSNAGEKSTFSGGSFTWTIGETAVGTISGTNVVLLQGFAPTQFTAGTPPTPPNVGPITQPTCAVATGSVDLSGLPSSGIWTLTRSPGGNTTTGTGTTKTISGLAAGTYTYTVTDANNLTSSPSANIVINTQPSTPTAPVVGTITQPTCALATGSVVLSGLPATGTWTITKSPGGTTSTGSGTSTTISGLSAGTYTYTVTNASNCSSVSSGNIVINPQPSTPTAPIVGTITQPTCDLATGSVVLSGLPATGTWTLTRSPGGTTSTGSGTSTTISGLSAGTYTYTVKNASNCTSVSSGNIVINTQPVTPSAPVVGTITQPTCALATGSVVLSGLPATGTWTLTKSPGGTTSTGTGTSTTISGLSAGTYTYTVTNASSCTSASSGNIVINTQPSTPTAPVIGTVTHPTCALPSGSVALSGLPSTGSWTVTRSPGGITSTGSGTTTTISGIPAGTYTFTVANASGCISTSSSNAVLNTPAGAPSAPVIGTITHPDCITTTGTVVLNGLPSSGTWTITNNYDGSTATGSGTSKTLTGLVPGTHTFSVTNLAGCISAPSSAAIINDVPSSPSSPVVGTIVHPDCSVTTGSVTLSGLPSAGSWTLTRTPDNKSDAGSGTSTTLTGIPSGTYTYTVTNASGCISGSSENITITSQVELPAAPVIGSVSHPTCAIPSGTINISGLPSSGNWVLTRNPGAVTTNGSGSVTSITGIPSGTYTFTVANSAGCSSLPSAEAVINAQPVLPAAPLTGTVVQPTCLVNTGSVAISGLPAGTWTLRTTPGGNLTGSSGSVVIPGLNPDTYTFTVTNSDGCVSPNSSAVTINEPDPGRIPSLVPKWQGEVLVVNNHGDSLKRYQWFKDGVKLQNDTLQYLVVKNTIGIYTVRTVDINGCMNFSSPYTKGITRSISAYPNPATGKFNMEFEGDFNSAVKISIYNPIGIKIMELKGESTDDPVFKNIDVSGLHKGTYLIKAENMDSETYYLKLIVVK